MKQRPRIHYTDADKAMMWNRWKKEPASINYPILLEQ